MSHLGSSDGQRVEKLSLQPVAERLSRLLNRPVKMAPNCIGPETVQMTQALQPGEVLLIENLRFHQEEDKNDPTYAHQLAVLGQVYVNDAFGMAHRAHASIEGIAHLVPGYAGFLMEQELDYLGSAMEHPRRPMVALVGGTKISDKIGTLNRLLHLADSILIGGAMANTFLKARGAQVGASLVENDKLDEARRIIAEAERLGNRFLLPVDVVIADRFAADAASQINAHDQVPAGWRILDSGPQTTRAFQAVLALAQTVVFNRTVGAAEFPTFARGTNALIAALAEATARGAMTIVGGGDSAASVEAAGAADNMSHFSTGGASLEVLEGHILPGVAALQERK